MLPLDQLKLRDLETSFMSRRHMFAIYNPEGRNVFKDFKVRDCSCAPPPLRALPPPSALYRTSTLIKQKIEMPQKPP
jgi:hypothetical protein